ncbi:fluoride efflux transporter FluC [Brachybacterium endophyticum]|uniref:fluoride efflux transporter FluC n=1 Tax=Brachybacterium endophyticum TaxID=2182385 RepID=UPI001F0CC0DB|nr:CrcB family protein [Brachybacterium endophyticum]
MRLLLGIGFIGGYTTYSALATDTALLIGSGSAGTGVGYALGTVLLGGIATWTGILIASLAHQPRTEARS